MAKKGGFFILIIACLLGYYYVSSLKREIFGAYIFGMMGLFGGYFIMIDYYEKSQDLQKWIQGSALLFRLAMLFSLPTLSDDFYRFVWDGKIILSGGNPYLFLPSEVMNQAKPAGYGIADIFPLLNSPQYYSVYPPVCQIISFTGVFVFPESLIGSVFIMKSIVFCAEMLNVFFLLRLAKQWKVNQKYVLLYSLNPMVIIELTGNLHFEALMITGMLGAVYFLGRVEREENIQIQSAYFILSTFFFAVAICSKLLPVVFLLFLVRKKGIIPSIYYGLIVLCFTMLMFLPFSHLDTFSHIFQSTRLYFKHFEFNASLYYLMKAISYRIVGYNWMVKVPFLFPIFTLAGLYFLEKKRFHSDKYPDFLFQCGWFLFIYLVFATTVNPWYVTPCIAFLCLSRYKFPILWSMLLPLTYLTFSVHPYKEKTWVILVEYLLLACFLGIELWQTRKSLFHKA